MAGDTKFGGVGALTIGGVAAVVVILGGIALTRLDFGGGEKDAAVQGSELPQNAAPAPDPDTVVEASSGETQQEDTSEGALAEAGLGSGNTAAETAVSSRTEETDSEVAEAPIRGATVDTADSETSATHETSPADVAALETTPIAEEPALEAEAILPAPEIDVVRFDSDGTGLIAGRAKAGVEVSIRLDGAVIETATVPASGEFVAFPVVEPSNAPRVVTVEAQDGKQIALAEGSFILAPVAPVEASEPSVIAHNSQASGGTEADTTTDIRPSATTENPAEQNDAAPLAEATQPATEGAIVAVGDTEERAGDGGNTALQQATAEDTQTSVEGQAALAVISTPDADRDDTSAKVSGTIESVAVEASQAEPPALRTPLVSTPPTPKPAAVAVLRTGPDGIEMIQPAAPPVPDLADKIALDAISYTPTGNVVLNGRARPSVLVRIYVDNTLVVDVDTAADGRWQTQLDDVAPGIYTLRLDEVDALEGKVLSRLETPFKREAPSVLAQQPAPEQQNSPDTGPVVRAVTVQKGDSLWAISQSRYGDGLLFVKVFEANRTAIRDPDLIYPGQVFTLPE